MLIIFSGLPGSGKSTIASALAKRIKAQHIRIDSIEQAMRKAGHDVTVAGYSVGYRIAEDNLRLGHIVVADSVNPIPETRDAWRSVGEACDARVIEIEVICADEAEHRRRVENRDVGIPGLVKPTWTEVISRDYHPWDRDHIVIDTAAKNIDACVDALIAGL